MQLSLEDNLHRELHIKGLASSDAWSAEEVARGITHQTETSACVAPSTRDLCPAATANSSGSLGKIDPIKHIEHVGLQPDSEPLGNWDILDDRQINSSIAGADEPVSR